MTIEAPTQWFKSSYSGGNNNTCVEARWLSGPNNNSCVEARLVSGGIEVRDSKDPGGATLRFGSDAWARFVRGLER
ncbi:DUF397 domain-containing protein [Saccharopolyspora indica]|uniref:DUF397 domain-containing protein n=1 Tax=Saccharopolyspora indica TaxID=1229659 RepID=UPI0022EAD241|nr:DUF397 domain-containing protein [Saccharopolyspora indica]MDA3649040.1 DUF397 domain-containing protein [Saccharopolyspora indica]